MALSDGDIIEIVDRQLQGADVTLNVYHYRINTSVIPPSPAQVAEFWWNDCNTVIRDLQTDDILHIRVTCRHLDNATNYGEYIIPEEEQAGVNTGVDTLPRQDAVGVTFQPAEPLVKPGSKRIAGIPENVSGNWGLLTSGFVTIVGEYGAHMSSQLNDVVHGAVLTPIIVGLPNDNRPSRVEIEMQGYVVNPYITTQNTRKIGRGA